MNIKQLIKRLPFAEQMHEALIGPMRRHSNNKILNRLKTSPHARGEQILHALEALQQPISGTEQEWIRRIESERGRLLMLEDRPVNDDSLEQSSPFDKQISISQACAASKPPKPGRMLFLLTRMLKPGNVIELGTNVGISSAFIGAALKCNQQDSRVITLDRSLYRQAVAKQVHRNLDLDNILCMDGLFSDTLKPALETMGSIDLAFIDGHHQYQPTLDYFDQIFKYSTPETVFVFDDIRWSDGMKQAWSQISSDERLGLVVDLTNVGVCARRQSDQDQRTVLDPLTVMK